MIPFKNISKEQSISDSLQLQTKLKSLESKSIRSIQVLLELVNEFEGIEKKLIKLVDELLLNLDKNRVSGLVLIDYCKAFDMVDHQILMSKLNAYGMDEKSALWFLSYLSGRQQFVSIDKTDSDLAYVPHGVPQLMLMSIRFLNPFSN